MEHLNWVTVILLWLFGGMVSLLVVERDVRGRARLALEHLRRAREETPSEIEDIRGHALRALGWGLVLVLVFLSGPLTMILMLVAACAIIAYRWIVLDLVKFAGSAWLIMKGLAGK